MQNVRPVKVYFLVCFFVQYILPVAALAADVSYEFIVDLSGSMNRYQEGASLKTHILKTLGEFLPRQQNYAVRVFGHRVGLDDKAKSCADTELIAPFGRHDHDSVKQKLMTLQARGFTPLANSLKLSELDLRSASGKRIIILLSDGFDSCDGDPVFEIEAMRAHGMDVIVNPIGIGLDETARAQLAELAALSGGEFVEVRAVKNIPAALKSALLHTDGTAHPRDRTKSLMPGDLGGAKDAGDSTETALVVRKNEWLSGSLGAKRADITDKADYFLFETTPGEKFTIEFEVLLGQGFKATVLDAEGTELETASDRKLQTDPINANKNGDKIFLRVTQPASNSPQPKDLNYRFKIISLVEIN